MTATQRVLLDAPSLGESEKRYLCRSISSGFVSTVGPFVPRFERKMAALLDVSDAVAVQSGTASLHIALLELGIGKGDEVIVPALTFIAAVNPVLYVGARPVFVDAAIDTWNIDPDAISRRITSRTKAILPVHLYGNPCNMDRIRHLARRHGIAIIEDATEGLGARFRGRYLGTLGTLGCYSFNGNKIITTGGGGMVVGHRRRQLSHVRFMINQARLGRETFSHPEVGYNYRMTNIEAALGLSQLGRLQAFLRKKKKFHDIYRQELSGSPVAFQGMYPHSESSWWFTAIMLEDRLTASRLERRLADKDIPVRRVFPPVTEQPPYLEYRQGTYPCAKAIYDRGLCLPCSVCNTEKQIADVAKKIRTILG